MRHARKARFPVAFVLILLMAAAVLAVGHNYLAHHGIHVQWDKGRKLQPAPTSGCPSGWLWKPSASEWICKP